MHPAYAHHYQHMTEEERKAFTEKYGQRCGTYYRERNADNSNKTDSIAAMLRGSRNFVSKKPANGSNNTENNNANSKGARIVFPAIAI